jgi:hypothetical protein
MMLLILLLVFTAVSLMSYAFLTRSRSVLLPSEAYAPVRYEAAHAPSAIIRPLYPLLNVLAPLFSWLPFPEYRHSLADNLRKAGFGDSVTPNHIFALKLITAIATPFVLRLLIASKSARS